jgi:hypothetical protein
MHSLRRCAEVLLVVDTCQASTMAEVLHDRMDELYAAAHPPAAAGFKGAASEAGVAGSSDDRLRVLSLSSSARGENSYRRRALSPSWLGEVGLR